MRHRSGRGYFKGPRSLLSTLDHQARPSADRPKSFLASGDTVPGKEMSIKQAAFQIHRIIDGTLSNRPLRTSEEIRERQRRSGPREEPLKNWRRLWQLWQRVSSRLMSWLWNSFGRLPTMARITE